MKQFAAVSLALASAAFAAPALATTDSHFSIGFVAQSLEYEEDGVLSESTLQGLEVRFFDRRGYWNGALDLRVMGGTGEYDGDSRADPGGPDLDEDTSEFLYEIEYRLGHHATSWAAPFAGIGYRRWQHDINGAEGYDRRLEYIYSPVGVQFDGTLGGRGFWQLYAAYNFLWDGRIKSDFTDAASQSVGGDARNSLSGGGGFDISLMLSYKLETGATVGVRPFLRYWDIDSSSTHGGTGNEEPEHEITSVGALLFITF